MRWHGSVIYRETAESYPSSRAVLGEGCSGVLDSERNSRRSLFWSKNRRAAQQNSIPDHLIHQLIHCAARFQNRAAVIHDPGQIGIRKCDSTERRISQDVARRGLSIFAEKESWLRTQVGVTPTVENDARDIALCVEAGSREHFAELLTNAPFIFTKGSGEHFRPPAMSLLVRRQARVS